MDQFLGKGSFVLFVYVKRKLLRWKSGISKSFLKKISAGQKNLLSDNVSLEIGGNAESRVIYWENFERNVYLLQRLSPYKELFFEANYYVKDNLTFF